MTTAAISEELKQISETLWELPMDSQRGMRVPGRVFATPHLLEGMQPGVFEQLANVATLPGIVDYAFGMPDAHHGYGFPIGGVAATDIENGGVISPGGIGFDINCGMRLLRTDLTYEEVEPKLDELMDALYKYIPAGLGRSALVKVSRPEFAKLLKEGAGWCVAHGYGTDDDLETTEERGCMPSADPEKISSKAVERGYAQVGTLGSGNHYLEIQRVRPENVVDPEKAAALGLDRDDQIVVMVHCGSRGFGHQVASDYLERFLSKSRKQYGIEVPDKELVAVPLQSKDGRDYYAAMAAAVNMAFANRQAIIHRVRQAFQKVFRGDAASLGLRQVYDVTHNTAKEEEYEINGEVRRVLVHRKGATRAFPPGSRSLPQRFNETGQPVIIGGSMQSGSYLLAGTESGKQSFYSTAHGSGRTMSRKQAKKRYHGEQLREDMREHGIKVRAASAKGLAEEAGGAYKDIDEVVDATAKAGLSAPVAKLVPVGCMKG